MYDSWSKKKKQRGEQLKKKVPLRGWVFSSYVPLIIGDVQGLYGCLQGRLSAI